MAKIVITGATGMIGRELVSRLAGRGDRVVVLSRNAEKARSVLGDGVETLTWGRPLETPPPREALAGADAVVNMMGEPISQRWTSAVKADIHASRVLGTRQLISGLAALDRDDRPEVLVCQSATGFYGPRGDEPLDEDSPAGDDFLARVVREWEQEAVAAEPLTRVVRTRTGVVLSGTGGALAVMLPFFRVGIGGPIAGGRQYVPWIHMDDVIGGLLLAVDSRDLTGPVNLTAPGVIDNRGFSKALGRALGRPAILPVPAFALKLLYGEMAQLVTTGQRVTPRRLLAAGYRFHQPDVDDALAALLEND